MNRVSRSAHRASVVPSAAAQAQGYVAPPSVRGALYPVVVERRPDKPLEWLSPRPVMVLVWAVLAMGMLYARRDDLLSPLQGTVVTRVQPVARSASMPDPFPGDPHWSAQSAHRAEVSTPLPAPAPVVMLAPVGVRAADWSTQLPPTAAGPSAITAAQATPGSPRLSTSTERIVKCLHDDGSVVYQQQPDCGPGARPL